MTKALYDNGGPSHRASNTVAVAGFAVARQWRPLAYVSRPRAYVASSSSEQGLSRRGSKAHYGDGRSREFGSEESVMRAPGRRRQRPKERAEPRSDVDFDALAACVRYVWSAEHKDQVGPAGLPRLRSDATRCPKNVTEEQVLSWLREAIAAGDVGGLWEGNPYPQLAWRRVGDTVFEARVSNAEQGWYHGYPIDPTEWPKWLA
jgi:hypothetical protein